MNRNSNRYIYLYQLVAEMQPKTIIEIGVAKGVAARQMLRISPNSFYKGYDVFDSMDAEFDEKVLNGKPALSKAEIYSKLAPYDVSLIQGMTQDTLWPFPQSAELVFIDGDHRVEAIRGDYEAVKNSKVIVFDDYYLDNDIDTEVFGCNRVIKELNLPVTITPPTPKRPDLRLAILDNRKKADE